MKVWPKLETSLSEIVKVLRQGEVVAAPTETAYGLLADATNNQAVKKVFKIKNRNFNKASALIVSDYKMAKKFGVFSPLAKKIASEYWPGPLTLVVKAKGGCLVARVKKNSTIAMRVPGSNWLRQLIKKVGQPLTATSANVGGEKNLFSASAVKNNLQPRGLKYLVNGGRLPIRAVSTIVSIKNNKLKILRAGKISIKN